MLPEVHLEFTVEAEPFGNYYLANIHNFLETEYY